MIAHVLSKQCMEHGMSNGQSAMSMNEVIHIIVNNIVSVRRRTYCNAKNIHRSPFNTQKIYEFFLFFNFL